MPSSSIGFTEFNVDEFRERLRKMSDAELLRCGKACASVCKRPPGFRIWTPNPAFAVQLQEARAEWRRRAALKKAAEHSPISA